MGGYGIELTAHDSRYKATQVIEAIVACPESGAETRVGDLVQKGRRGDLGDATSGPNDDTCCFINILSVITPKALCRA